MIRARNNTWRSFALAAFFCLGQLPSVEAGPASEQKAVATEDLEGLSFRSVGPHRGGRSTAVAGVPEDPFTYYMGTSGGGVWKSENAGTSWNNISDGFFSSASIGSIAVAASDSHVIYVGTGSGCPRGNVMNGDGIYRSTDAGRSWQHLGLTKAGLIPKIVVDPKNSDLVYAAVLGDIFEPSADRGVFRSRDGGQSWKKVHAVSERTGAVDLAMNPLNSTELYAAMWTVERKPWTLVDGGSEGGVFKSTDGGDSWEKVTGGLPEGLLGRIGLTVSPSHPDRVWAQVTTADDQGGLFRSDDAGKSFKRVYKGRDIQVRAWYYAHIHADPQDADTVYSSGLRFRRSIDGGRSFESIRTPHGDHHALWINPERPEIMVQGNDGGATVTLDGGKTWSTQFNQPTAEFYRLTVDDGFPYRLYGAQQDNTSIAVPAWSAGGLSAQQEWWLAGGGESGDIAVHPENPEVVYSGNYIGLIERWDRRSDERRGIMVYPELADGVAPRDLKYRFQWNAPIRLSPHDPSTLYQASHQVHRSRDEGQSWQTLSEDLTYDDESKQALPGGPIQHDDTGVEVYSTVFALEESPVTKGLLWAGTDDGRLHVSEDDGASWLERTPPGLAADTTINSIELSSRDASRVMFAAHRYRVGDDRPYVFLTTNGGRSWKSLSAGLPQDVHVRVVREDPTTPGLLFVGSERGIHFSTDDGESWQPLKLNLPVAQVSDLAVRHGDLVVATHGRSFWVLDDLSPLRQWAELDRQKPAHLFRPAPAYQVDAGGRFSSGPEPDARKTGALFHLWVQPDFYQSSTTGSLEHPARLEVLDAEDQPVRSFELVTGDSGGEGSIMLQPGLNRFRWDLLDQEPETLDGAVMSLGYTGGAVVPPGEYRLRVELEGQVWEEVFELLPDPRLEIPPADYQAGYELAQTVRERLVEIHSVVRQLRSVREQVEALEARAEASKVALPMDTVREDILEPLVELEERLIQTRAEAPQDPLNFPPKLDNQYSFLYGEVSFRKGLPNAGAYQRLQDLDQVWLPLKREWEGLQQGSLALFNRRVAELGVPAVLVPQRESETSDSQGGGRESADG